jgi:hypothetical protein
MPVDDVRELFRFPGNGLMGMAENDVGRPRNLDPVLGPKTLGLRDRVPIVSRMSPSRTR